MSKRINMPRVVRLLGQRIEIKVGKGKADEVKAEAHLGQWVHEHEGFENVGAASLRFGRIGIDTRQSQDQQLDTFVHENLHLMLMVVQQDDEETVSLLTPVLIDWLRRNPKAVEYIMQKRLIEGWW